MLTRILEIHNNDLMRIHDAFLKGNKTCSLGDKNIFWNLSELGGMINIYSKKEYHFPKWMGSYPRVNAPWSNEEEEELLRGYRDENLTIEQLCKKHGRASGGVISRLSKFYPEIEKIRIAQRELETVENDLIKLEERAKVLREMLKEYKT